jgi:cytochrome P450
MTLYYKILCYEVFSCKSYLCVLLQTAFSVASALYNLAKNPDKQQNLFEEIQRYVPDKDQPVTSDILNELKYLKACIKESMRYHQNTVECSS